MRFIAGIALALTVPLESSANTYDVMGLRYTTTSSTEATCIGFTPGTVVDYDCTVNIQSTVEGHTVTGIAAKAFFGEGNEKIKHVVFPSRLEYIGKRAFGNCVNLEEVIIPQSITEIGEEAFANCSTLALVSVDAEYIRENAFANCCAITALQLGAHTKYIEPGAFYGCLLLTYVDIPWSVRSLGSGYTYANTVGVFENCPLLQAVTFSLNISDTTPQLEVIGPRAFYDCASLQRLDLPYSVTSIREYAFTGCNSLAHIEWGGPKDLTVSSMDATGLKRLVFHGNVTIYDSGVFRETATSLVQVRYDQYATKVQADLFMGIKSLKELHMESIESIGNNAFKDCTSLESVVLPETLTKTGISSFAGCTALKSIELPQSLTTVSESLFEGDTSLESITFGENVTRIDGKAFKGCHSLKSIVFPMSLSNIATSCLDNCQNLTSITIGGEKALNGLDNALAKDSPLESLTLRGNVTARFNRETLRKVTFSDYCDEISGSCFTDCVNLTDVDFSYIKKLGRYSFRNCTSLASVDLSNVEEISYYAFCECANLAQVTLGDKLTEIGDHAFSKTAISSLKIPDSVTSFGYLEECPNLTEIIYGDGLTNISGKPRGCDKLTKVELGRNVTHVDLYYFTNLKNLTVKTTTPPHANSFKTEIYNAATLWVPTGCAEAYRAATTWKNFTDIRERDFAGIEDVKADAEGVLLNINGDVLEISSDRNLLIHDIRGRKVVEYAAGMHHISLSPGIYIVSAEGFVKKVIL